MLLRLTSSNPLSAMPVGGNGLVLLPPLSSVALAAQLAALHYEGSDMCAHFLGFEAEEADDGGPVCADSVHAESHSVLQRLGGASETRRDIVHRFAAPPISTMF